MLNKFKLYIEDNNGAILKIILIFLATLLLFFLPHLLKDIVPENLISWNGPEIKSLGFVLMVILIIITILLTNAFSSIKPKLKDFQIILLIGFGIFMVEFLYKLIQNVLIYKINLCELVYQDVIGFSVILGMLAMPIANIRLHRLSQKSIIKPIFLLLIFWFIIGRLFLIYSKFISS